MIDLTLPCRKDHMSFTKARLACHVASGDDIRDIQDAPIRIVKAETLAAISGLRC